MDNEELQFDIQWGMVKKLIGPVFPIGETNTDNDNYVNQQFLEKLTYKMLEILLRIRMSRKEYAYSEKRAGESAECAIEGMIELINYYKENY